MSTPLLILSDSPTSGTGLGRITRDLATRIAQHMPDVYRVATAGYGGDYSRALPFAQYHIDFKDWVVYNLPEIWSDFAGDEQGIIFTIWDASRLLWFARPENCPDPRLQQFLQAAKFKRWAYLPIDATGPNDKLTAVLKHTIEGYDRILAYSAWAAEIVDRTLGHVCCEWRPHGINTSVFYPRHRHTARHGFGQRIDARTREGRFFAVPDDSTLVGIVATNQTRKDWGLGIQVAAELRKDRPVTLWLHTDTLERHWSIPALLNDFGFNTKPNEVVVTTVPLTDEQMAWCYSACDVTLGIGNGEGYGFPIFESLACGVPCIHGDYGGAPEHMPDEMLVEWEGYRLEGPYNCVRPFYHVQNWTGRTKYVLSHRKVVGLPPHLDWKNLWPNWEEWLRRGVA